MCAKARTAPPACKEVAVAATRERLIADDRLAALPRQLRVVPWRWLRRTAALLGSLLGGVFGGLLASSSARAVELPADAAETLYHSYNGGGVNASGPAFLVRKQLGSDVSLSASYYVDAVSNASIDVVTTASPYREERKELGLGADYVYRDSKISWSALSSHEPDYVANSMGLDIAQETFGGMTTVSLGFGRGADQIGKTNAPEFAETATHWQYRAGISQVLSPRWIASANAEVLADEGFLGSPYRVARVFGAIVPERTPRTRSARALKFRVLGDLGNRDAVHADYRYFSDTWDIKAQTVELGYSRYFGEQWLLDTSLRFYKQDHALFYSDNAMADSTYISRNRQLSSFSSTGLGAKLSYALGDVVPRVPLKLHLAYEYTSFTFSDFTDIRSGALYAYNANVLQLFLSANF